MQVAPRPVCVDLRKLYGTTSSGPLGPSVFSYNGHDVNFNTEVYYANQNKCLMIPLDRQETYAQQIDQNDIINPFDEKPPAEFKAGPRYDQGDLMGCAAGDLIGVTSDYCRQVKEDFNMDPNYNTIWGRFGGNMQPYGESYGQDWAQGGYLNYKKLKEYEASVSQYNERVNRYNKSVQYQQQLNAYNQQQIGGYRRRIDMGY
jgi:hypothetical protein